MSLLTYSFARKHLPKSQNQNANIKPETPVVHVPHIQCELPFPAHIIAAVYLGPARDTRLYIMPTRLLRRVVGQILSQQWPWTNQAHVTSQYIPQLWQLIEAESSEKAAEASQTRRIRRRIDLRTISHHGAKLDDCKRSRFVAGTNLPEEDRRSHRKANYESNYQKQWRHHYQSQGGDSNIQRAFAESVHRSPTYIAEAESSLTGAGIPRCCNSSR